MKYIAAIEGKKYEIEVERIDPYRPLSRGEEQRQAEASLLPAAKTEASPSVPEFTPVEAAPPAAKAVPPVETTPA